MWPQRNTIDFDHHHNQESTAHNTVCKSPHVTEATEHNAESTEQNIKRSLSPLIQKYNIERPTYGI